MPTYEYKCTACGHQFELFQSMKDSSKRKCPKCGKNTLERLIGTGAAIIFKGSGFYQTDYRSEAYKKAASADSSPNTSESSTSSSSDSAKSEPSSSNTSEPKPTETSTKPAETKTSTDKPAKSEPKPEKKPKGKKS